MTNVGGGRKLDMVGVVSTMMGCVGVASTTKVADGVASGITGGSVGKSPGVNVGSGVAVAVLSGGGTRDDWNVERASAPPDIEMVKTTARAKMMIRAGTFRGRVCKVKNRPCAGQSGAIIA